MATAHPCDRDQKHLSRPHFRCVVRDVYFFNHGCHLCKSIKWCVSDKPQPGWVSVSRGKGKSGCLRTSLHSLECNNNALRARGQRQTGPGQGPHSCASGRASIKQLCWGFLGFLLLAPVIHGVHLCLVAATVQHPSAKIHQQTETLTLPPVSVSSIHSLLSL